MSFIILALVWLTLFSVYRLIIKIVSLKKLWEKKPETYWADPTQDAGMQYQF